MPVADDVLIAGGGIAAVRTAQALRSFGYDGRVSIFTDEPDLPYDRPPLSKAHLVERRDGLPDPILTHDQLAALDIVVELERSAVDVNTVARWLILDDGETVPYDALVLATGARPRSVPALSGSGRVHELRSADDARRLSATLLPAAQIVIIGAGFIGLEVAAAARMNGCQVTVVEVRATPLADVVGPWLGGEVQAWHERQGVRFVCDAAVQRVEDAGGTCRLTLSDGQALPADAVVVGVGVEPEADWLRRAAGLRVDRGVVCDAFGQTSVPWVYAVGDVAQRMDGERQLTTGHWTAATEHAISTAATMLGRFADRRPPSETFFWSDQYGCKLQYAGRFPPDGEVTVESGSLPEWSFLVTCRIDGELVGALAADKPGPFVRARAALERSSAASKAHLLVPHPTFDNKRSGI